MDSPEESLGQKFGEAEFAPKYPRYSRRPTEPTGHMVHFDGTLAADVGEVWETEGGRLWQIIDFNSIWKNAPIVARNVTPGSVTADLPRGFDRYGQMVDGNAKLVRRVL